ncbi:MULTISPECIES: monovalent cation/H+ antiporter subunit D [Rheinheimera]|uniref:Monovalent cation/H+ antiporter subunit D n=1 Tax=Rheinheimera marina TaxID=1774958 RepID=A0ABV9JM46_9GAMM
MTNHWIVLPVVWPLLVALCCLLPPFDTVTRYRRMLSFVGTLGLLLISLVLWQQSAGGQSQLYQLGNWPAPFGISLLLDKVSVLMLMLTAVLGLAALLYANAGDDEQGPFFHSLFHFQLMGINGAFLTADLFNLFVFFEVLLIASYSLLIHGGGKAKTKAAVHYVVLNLLGSALFLFALALIYGAAGSLNMLDLAVRLQHLSASQQLLMQGAAALLLLVFGLKAAMMPLHFWLGSAYASASPAVAALFAVMTKVGIFSVLRVFLQVFADADYISSWALSLLWWGGLLTIVVGAVAVLASEDFRRLVAYLVVLSVGAMIAGLSLGTPSALQAVLYYAVHSTFACAALFLLADLIAEQRGKAADRLVTGRRVTQPLLLGCSFAVLALSATGMPPFSGFIGKLMLLQSVSPGWQMVLYWGAILLSSFVVLLALSRSGVVLFWQVSGRNQDSRLAGARRASAVILLTAASVLLSVFAGPLTEWCLQGIGQFSQLVQLIQGGQL